MIDNYQLITEKQAAKLLAVSPGTLRVQRCVGASPKGLPMIPFVRIGRAVRYRLRDIQRYIDGQDVYGTPDHADETTRRYQK